MWDMLHLFIIHHSVSGMFVCLMVFSATFNNISFISWQSVLLVEETGGPGENHQPVKLYHIMLYTSPWSRFELTTSVVIGTDCIGSCKSNYHTITSHDWPCFWDDSVLIIYIYIFDFHTDFIGEESVEFCKDFPYKIPFLCLILPRNYF